MLVLLAAIFVVHIATVVMLFVSTIANVSRGHPGWDAAEAGRGTGGWVLRSVGEGHPLTAAGKYGAVGGCAPGAERQPGRYRRQPPPAAPRSQIPEPAAPQRSSSRRAQRGAGGDEPPRLAAPPRPPRPGPAQPRSRAGPQHGGGSRAPPPDGQTRGEGDPWRRGGGGAAGVSPRPTPPHPAGADFGVLSAPPRTRLGGLLGPTAPCGRLARGEGEEGLSRRPPSSGTDPPRCCARSRCPLAWGARVTSHRLGCSAAADTR